MGVVGRLSLARLRHRPGPWVLLAVGVALALALPVLSAAIGRLVAVATLRQAVEQLEPGERTVVVAYGGSRDPAVQRGDDALVRAGLARLTSLPVTHQMLYGELADSRGVSYRLGASEGLAQQVRLTSGRLPRSCTPTRCEVVLTGDGVVPRPDDSLGLVVVGTADRVDPLLLPGTFDPGSANDVLLGADPDTLARLTSLERFPRGAGWVAPLDAARVTELGVPAYADLSRDVTDEMSLRIPALVLDAPDDALLREDARAAASQSRFAVLGGATAVLVLGFVLVAAAGLRRDHGEAAGLLRRRGAGRAALVTLAVLGPAVAVALGTLAGLALGWAAAWLATSSQPLHPPALAAATTATVSALPLVLLLAAAAVAVTALVLLWPDARERTAWHVVELLAAACLGAAVLAAARGSASAGDATDPLAPALPVLVLVAAALVAARLWPPLARWTSRHLPRRAVPARLAAAGGVHRPLRAVVTVGCVTAAVGTVVFAGAYRATLEAGSADSAAYAVPTDARLVASSGRETPLDVAASAPPPGTVWGVLRGAAGVRETATSGEAVGYLGLDPAVLAHVARWDRTVGGSDPRLAASLLGTPADVGTLLPDDLRTLSVPLVSWQRTPGIGVEVIAWVGSADGRERAVPLTRRDAALVGDLPELGAGRRLLALTLRQDPGDLTRHLHQSGEGGTSTELPGGRLVLGAPPSSSWAGWTSRTAVATASADRLVLDYRLEGSQVVARPGLGERAPVPVLADPATAARGSTLRLDLGGGDSVEARVVGSLPRFPTMGPRFVLADRSTLAAAVDDERPGEGASREAWVTGDASALAEALGRAPYDRVVVTTQESRRTALESDAVGQGAGWILAVAGAVALAVGLLSLVLLVVADRRDDDATLLAQEADGVSTGTLRWSLWLRAVAAGVPALVAGLVVGLLLTNAVASLVAVSAGGTAPTPPLMPTTDASGTAVTLVVGFVVALAVCGLVAGRMLRETWPSSASRGLR